MRRLPETVRALLAAAGLALPIAVHAACEITAPAMLDLYLAGRDAGDAVRAVMVRAASSGRIDEALALNASMTALNTQVWGIYWLSLYSRRLHEVLEYVDAGRELSSQSLSTGTVRGYYSRWDASQLTSSAAMAVRTAGDVAAALLRVEAVAGPGITILSAEAAKLRQYAARVGNELQGCTRPQ